MGKKNKGGMIYSTNPNYEFESGQEQETLHPSEQTLRLLFEKKGRAGKIAIIVDGFIGSKTDLKALSKELKNACGVGGSEKNGQIIIQGKVRDKISEILVKKGFKVKRVGG